MNIPFSLLAGLKDDIPENLPENIPAYLKDTKDIVLKSNGELINLNNNVVFREINKRYDLFDDIYQGDVRQGPPQPFFDLTGDDIDVLYDGDYLETIVRVDNTAEIDYDYVKVHKEGQSYDEDSNTAMDIDETDLENEYTGYDFFVSYCPIKIADDFWLLVGHVYADFDNDDTTRIVAFTSTDKTGTYTLIDPEDFEIRPTEDWEDKKIEQEWGLRKIEEDDQYIYLWFLYTGQQGDSENIISWWKGRIDKTNKTIEYIERFEDGPLTQLKTAGYDSFRNGSAYPEKLWGYYPITGYTRNLNDNKDKVTKLNIVLCEDKMLTKPVTKTTLVDHPHKVGNNIIEKTPFLPIKDQENEWLLMYEYESLEKEPKFNIGTCHYEIVKESPNIRIDSELIGEVGRIQQFQDTNKYYMLMKNGLVWFFGYETVSESVDQTRGSGYASGEFIIEYPFRLEKLLSQQYWTTPGDSNNNAWLVGNSNSSDPKKKSPGLRLYRFEELTGDFDFKINFNIIGLWKDIE